MNNKQGLLHKAILYRRQIETETQNNNRETEIPKENYYETSHLFSNSVAYYSHFYKNLPKPKSRINILPNSNHPDERNDINFF